MKILKLSLSISYNLFRYLIAHLLCKRRRIQKRHCSNTRAFSFPLSLISTYFSDTQVHWYTRQRHDIFTRLAPLFHLVRAIVQLIEYFLFLLLVVCKITEMAPKVNVLMINSETVSVLSETHTLSNPQDFCNCHKSELMILFFCCRWSPSHPNGWWVEKG